MSTDQSLKHLKSNDKLLIANVSNYFENTQGGIACHIHATGVSRRTVFRVRKEL